MTIEERPTLLSPAVLEMAAARMLTAIEDLRQFKADAVMSAKVIATLVDVLSRQDDAFDRCQDLYTAGLGPCQGMVDIVHQRTGHERFALQVVETDWVLRSGVRFPAREGDVITVRIKSVKTKALVQGVFANTARGNVRPVQGEPEQGLHNVTAEDVVSVWVAGAAVPAHATKAKIGFQKVKA